MTQALNTNLESTKAHPVSPWSLGLAAARRNAVPAVFLALFALTLGLSYAFVGPVHNAFDRFADWREKLVFPLNWAFPAITTAFFGAIVPWLVQRLRPNPEDRPNARDLAYFTGFWALKGIEIHVLYIVLDAVIGSGASVGVILGKLAFDMGFYCPVWAVPTTLLAYQFRERGFSWSGVRDGPLAHGFKHWVRWSVLPVVVNNWFVWIPAVIVIYTMPLALQLPFQNLVLCFWCLVLAFLSDAVTNGQDSAARQAEVAA
ncbi:MAG: Mpv17/PMP22 family protein [Planctomycetota bacterium]